MGRDDKEQDQSKYGRSERRERSRDRSSEKDKNNKKQMESKSKNHKKDDSNDKKKRKRSSSRSNSSNSSSSSSSQSSHSSTQKREAEKILEQHHMRQKLIEQELGYTKEENPFGDKQLNETILANWGQKRKAKTLEENTSEIQHIKAIRQQRIEDERRQEEERGRQQREREEENYEAWKAKEESFHAYQARIRALVRITQGKETTTDKINKIFYIYRGKIKYSEHLESVMCNIQGFLSNQDEAELNKILAQAVNHHNQLTDPQQLSDQQYKDQEEIDKFASFWESIKSITMYYIDEIKRQREHKEVLPEFESEVKAIFEGKSLSMLIDLEKDISLSLQHAQFEEQEYWQNMMKRLQLYKGNMMLREFYDYFIKHQKFNQLEDALEIEVENKVKPTEEQILTNDIIKEQEMAEAHIYSPVLGVADEQTIRQSQTQEEFTDQVKELRGLFYKKILKRAMAAIQVKKEKDQKQLLVDTSQLTQMNTVGQSGKANDGDELDAATLRMLEIERKKPLEDDEAVFDDHQTLNTTYEWADKVKSKKPRYFNRVKQGFDWNKYNQMHHDSDNPPPKYIQGYKFNIFFPELAEKEKTPEYFLERTDDPNYCLIRFSAGPPYEDIAFKILNKEWDYGDKKGFKCFFNRGVLTLHFNFKRNRYRR